MVIKQWTDNSQKIHALKEVMIMDENQKHLTSRTTNNYTVTGIELEIIMRNMRESKNAHKR